MIWSKLQDIENQYVDLETKLQDPSLIQKKDLYSKTIAGFSKLKPVVEIYREYKQLKKDLLEHKNMEKESPDLSPLIKEELEKIECSIKIKEEKLNQIINETSENSLDKKDIILELRSGAGGEEAGLFCKELYQAYEKYSSSKKWKVEVLSCSLLSSGGFREITSKISGERVFFYFKFEKGVHRVQRIPKTESQGRVHTSTVTVAVLPSADRTEVHIKNEDVRIDVCRSSGAGGQHVNTTDSAVRIVHLPTKLTVYCQEEKSQHANKEKAFKILYARLFALKEEEKRKKDSSMRLQQIGTGDRSEKIRTYNFPQSRITDHRVSLSIHSLDRFMKGEIELLSLPLEKECSKRGIRI